jgi:hypothetical protein
LNLAGRLDNLISTDRADWIREFAMERPRRPLCWFADANCSDGAVGRLARKPIREARFWIKRTTLADE